MNTATPHAGVSARPLQDVRVTVLSTGHQALDHRLFDKEGRSLARAGADVRILAAHPRRERIDGVAIEPLPRSGGRLARFALAPWRALALANRERSAVVHIHDFELLQICPLLKLLWRPVIVYDVHEDFANLMLRRDWIPRPLRRPVRMLLVLAERLLARSVDAVVTVSGTLAERFADRPHAVLYNLPSRAFAEQAGRGAQAPSRRPVDVVHLGVLSGERMRFLAEVLERLAERRPDARFRVVGVEPGQAEYLSERLGERLEVRGKLPYSEIPGLLRECKLGVNVHPRLYPHLRPAVPVKVLEYMAAGCGIVTSSLPELDGLLEQGARERITVLREGGPDRYADALAASLADPEALDAASERLRTLAAERYSWESQEDKLSDLYSSLLSTKDAD